MHHLVWDHVVSREEMIKNCIRTWKKMTTHIVIVTKHLVKPLAAITQKAEECTMGTYCMGWDISEAEYSWYELAAIIQM